MSRLTSVSPFPHRRLKRPARYRMLLYLSLLAPFTSGLIAQSVSFLGSQTVVANSFVNPLGIAVDPAGNVYVVDAGNTRVVKIAPGASPDCSSGCVQIAAGFNAPNGIALSTSGDIYVTDSAAGLVVKISSGGAKSTVVPLTDPQGIAIDATNNLYVTLGGGALVEVTPAGVVSFIATGLNAPQGVTLDANSNIYVVDSGNNQVVKFTPDGERSIVVTGLSMPVGVAVDEGGMLYVADTANNRIVKVPAVSAGINCASYCLTLGSGLADPTSIFADSIGNIYLSDARAQTVEISSSVDFGIASVGENAAVSRTLLYGLSTADCSAVGNTNVLTRGVLNQDFTSMPSANVCTPGSPTTLSVTIDFTARFAGTRNGSVQLTDGNGALQAVTYIHGVGSGPQVIWTPGVLSNVIGP